MFASKVSRRVVMMVGGRNVFACKGCDEGGGEVYFMGLSTIVALSLR